MGKGVTGMPAGMELCPHRLNGQRATPGLSVTMTSLCHPCQASPSSRGVFPGEKARPCPGKRGKRQLEGGLVQAGPARVKFMLLPLKARNSPKEMPRIRHLPQILDDKSKPAKMWEKLPGLGISVPGKPGRAGQRSPFPALLFGRRGCAGSDPGKLCHPPSPHP